MTKIRFTINYEVKVKRKFEQFLAKYSEEIESDFQELEITSSKIIGGMSSFALKGHKH